MQKTTLLLFDIDGTLLTSGGAGEHALKVGFREEFGIEDDLQNVEIAGRTDSGIARQMLAYHNIDVTPETLDRFYQGYLRNLVRELPSRTGTLLPGVEPLLKELHARSHVALALLTGNLERGARLKLAHYGVADFFPFGAFADDHHDRNALGEFAQRRATELHGVRFEPARTTIIGDTPHDISCARAIGARVLAVATGAFSADALAKCNPDAVLENLADIGSALRALNIDPAV
jgi:phosphoglycolate phosphatase-like HAD superfamily hydrolase